MICPACHGKGVEACGELAVGVAVYTLTRPCIECGGYGVVHCCDGLIEQPLDHPVLGDLGTVPL